MKRTYRELYDATFAIGKDAYHNGMAKTHKAGPDASLTEYKAWHDGWMDAWKADTKGQIKLGVYR